MPKEEFITRMTSEEMRLAVERGEDRTDWAKVDAMSQEEVERLAGLEDGPLPEGWENTIFTDLPLPKQPVSVRLDADVLAWFKAGGPGYQTRINAVLSQFVHARQKADAKG